jgi:hypothetical protein
MRQKKFLQNITRQNAKVGGKKAALVGSRVFGFVMIYVGV